MKKILGTLILIIIILTGCENKESDYNLFKDDLLSMNDAQALDFSINTSYLPDFEVIYTADTSQQLYKMVVGPTSTYVTNEYIYFSSGSGWIKSNVNEQLLIEFQMFGEFAAIITHLPNGDYKLPDDCTGIEEIDKIISGKSVSDLIVKTGVNTYTIKGLENQISFNTSNGLIISIDTQQSGQLNVTIKKSEQIVIPDNALNAPTSEDFNYELIQ